MTALVVISVAMGGGVYLYRTSSSSSSSSRLCHKDGSGSVITIAQSEELKGVNDADTFVESGATIIAVCMSVGDALCRSVALGHTVKEDYDFPFVIHGASHPLQSCCFVSDPGYKVRDGFVTPLAHRKVGNPPPQSQSWRDMLFV